VLLSDAIAHYIGPHPEQHLQISTSPHNHERFSSESYDVRHLAKSVPSEGHRDFSELIQGVKFASAP